MLIKTLRRCSLWLAAAAFAGAAWAQPSGAPADTVNALQAQREELFDARHVDVPAMSRDISVALGESKRLEAAGDHRAALDRLMQLQKYAPLDYFPSFEVHLLASFLYGKLGDATQQRLQLERANAYAVVLARSGKGDTPDDPARLVMNSEITDWARAHGGAVTEVHNYPWHGHELLQVTYAGTATGNQPRQFYVELDPRTRQMSQREMRRFAPFPIDQMAPDMTAALEKARSRRAAFLADHSFDYLKLRELVNAKIKEAATLDMQGKTQDALAALRQVEQLRPIEDIPTPRLLSVYSYLVGKAGDTQKQRELRTYIFGVQQAIAHSGDARSDASAMQVILIDEEYEVLADRQLKLVKQQLVDRGARKFDVLTGTDGKGQTSELWFDITALSARSAESMFPAQK